jgi:uncharacterized protein (TIGR03083 family)
MGWRETRAAALAELDAVVRTAQSLPAEAWDRPSACPAWTIGDVGAHLASVIDAQQRAFEEMLAGGTTTPDWTNASHESPTTTMAALERAHAQAQQVLGRLSDEHASQLVPLPFGSFPCPAALDIILLEYGSHRWDIESAIDPGAALSPEAATCILRLMPAFMLFYATPPPEDAIAYRLEAPAVTIEISAGDDGWRLEPAAVPTTSVRGDDSSIALFMMGRIGPADGRVTVKGRDADAFKHWFPGP